MKKYKPLPVEAKPDFPKLEADLLKYWYKTGIVKEYLKKNQKSKKYFSFLDGPITANNPMGVHHGWGRTYKDLWQRFYNMQGFRQRFQNGFDSQGLWVEVEVEKELGFKTKKDIEKYGVAKFVEKCKQRVLKFSQIQTNQSKRLGYFVDWDHSYFTMSDENNYMIWYFLKVCHDNGWLYKGKESVPWCPRCETAISQHEMLTEDYKEVTHESIYLKLPILKKPQHFLLIWTTTPWTIPANIAVAVDEDLNYSLVQDSSGDKIWVAEDSLKRLFSDGYKKIEKTVKGKNLVGIKYKAPFDDLESVSQVANKHQSTFHRVIPTDKRILPIVTTEGTGLVHTAVSAGTEDFKLGKKLGLPMIPVIADDASYLSDLGFLSGKNAKKHPELILEFLKSEDEKKKTKWIFKLEDYRHRYPACWRCKEELVWKVTDEWYIAMDKGKPSLRQRMIRVAKKIDWIPGFGLDRELDWLNNMHDWLISKKNRYWGLCLPIWECTACGNFEVVGSKEELESKAVKGWEHFKGKSPHKPQLDQVKINCSKCGHLASRVEPVGNPWLDAGIVAYSTVTNNNQGKPLYLSDKKTWEKWIPADLITESFPGQFKNWFYSLIAMSTVLENKQPCKTVLGFATLLAENGKPMHKSWGNMIEFNEAAEKIGVDVMRWIYCRQDPSQNLLFGYQNADLIRRQFHLILWNSYRFVVNNFLNDKPNLSIKEEKFHILDKWIRSRFDSTIDKVTVSLKKYDSQTASKEIEDFVQDFSTWYIRRSRDRIGVYAKNLASKRAFYITSIKIIKNLSLLLAPLNPFISDLMYRNLTGNKSVHLDNWPKSEGSNIDKNLETQMAVVRLAAEKFHGQRKKAGVKLRQPLNKAFLTTEEKIKKDLLEVLKQEINVGTVKWEKKPGDLKTSLDFKLTPDLKRKGEMREIIRRVQQERKKLKVSLDEKVNLYIKTIPDEYIKLIREKTLAAKIITGRRFKVEKVDGE